jgi:hypothetical protein
MTDQGVEYKVSITQNGSILGPGEDDSQDFMELQPELVQGNKAGGGWRGGSCWRAEQRQGPGQRRVCEPLGNVRSSIWPGTQGTEWSGDYLDRRAKPRSLEVTLKSSDLFIGKTESFRDFKIKDYLFLCF